MNVMKELLEKLPLGLFSCISETGLLGQSARISVDHLGDAYHIRLAYDLPGSGVQDDYFVRFKMAFHARFLWSPHLTPEAGDIVEQHVFRTPAMIACGDGKWVAVLPDIDTMGNSPVRYYMDLDAPEQELTIGMSQSEIREHVLYRKRGGATYPADTVTFGFILLLSPHSPQNPFRPVLDYYWRRYGHSEYVNRVSPFCNLSVYAGYAYGWAFDRWKDAVWQEFEERGTSVGAPVFIVTAHQSPNNRGEYGERETRSIWNQAWFCSLRSASGLYRHARRTANQELLQYALKTKELALLFPQRDGLFDSVIATEMEQNESGGRKLWRSKGWATRYFGNSNRNPFRRDIRDAPRHILDMSFTAYHMLVWYDELERDERLAQYALRYADKLITLQDACGYFPAWVDRDGERLGVLDQSPESAMSAAFLFTCYKIFGSDMYLQAALRSVSAVMKDIVPEGRWEDFETYWSCSRWWSDHSGEKIERNGMYKSCNLSMFYTAYSLLLAYEATGQANYLECGQRVLDELLMTQASYQPNFMPVPVFGGFGVMNADGEWNDARQSLFAELILQYGMKLKQPEYVERGLAALRASFSMMYCPDNPKMKKQWEKVWPFFNEMDYGFSMENYGHEGKADQNGVGIGEFTIYDWGNGAAAEAYERMLDHWGDDLIEYSKLSFS